MPRAKTSNQLTKRELIFVACYAGNQVEAAKLAGFKNAQKQASAIYNRPRVKGAIEQKQKELAKASGQELAKAITITRNDIINRLDRLSEHAESDSTKVSALGELVDIFGLRAKDGKHDLFAGWTEEELTHYADTGELPARYRSVLGTGEGAGDSSAVTARPTTRAQKR